MFIDIRAEKNVIIKIQLTITLKQNAREFSTFIVNPI